MYVCFACILEFNYHGNNYSKQKHYSSIIPKFCMMHTRVICDLDICTFHLNDVWLSLFSPFHSSEEEVVKLLIFEVVDWKLILTWFIWTWSGCLNYLAAEAVYNHDNDLDELIMFKLLGTHPPPCAVTFPWWGIVYLNDPDSYADWSFILLHGRASQVRQVEG